MSRKRNASAKRPQMDVRDDPKSGWERYLEGASHSIDTFYGHATPNGNVWLLSHSSAQLRTAEDFATLREEIIAFTMATPVVLMFGSPPVETFEYVPSREEAEQKADLVFGVWPLPRVLCTPNPNGYANCQRRFEKAHPKSIAA